MGSGRIAIEPVAPKWYNIRAMMQKGQYKFSNNLFWDADPADMDLQRNKRYIVQRVLERGTVEDLRAVFHIYGLENVVAAAKSLRTLEPRALSFISCVAGEPKENFRCYMQKQSKQAPWIY